MLRARSLSHCAVAADVATATVAAGGGRLTALTNLASKVGVGSRLRAIRSQKPKSMQMLRVCRQR